MELILRDYQEKAINDIRSQFMALTDKKVVYVAPCGAGKTAILSYMAHKASQNKLHVMFLVHRRELLSQTMESIQKFGFESDYIKAYTIQSVVRKLDKIVKPDLIIMDECHHAVASTWLKVLNHFPNAYVVGLTATPIRLNGEGLGRVFKQIILGPTVPELISNKYLTSTKYYAFSNGDGLHGRVVAGEYDLKSTASKLAGTTIYGDAVEQYKKHANGTQAMAYCINVEASQTVCDNFNRAGIPAEHIDAKTPKKQRVEILQKFKRGEIKILTNCELFGEGVDVPAMETVILLRPTKSLSLYIQQAMRGMRPDKNNPNKVAIILDHVGNIYEHGPVEMPREWSLADKIKKQKKFEGVEIKTCPKCFAVVNKTDKVCKYCGAKLTGEGNERKINKVDAELVDVTDRFKMLWDLGTNEIERKKKRNELIAACVTYSDYCNVARLLGYKKGWAWYQWQLKNKKSKTE